MLVVGSTSPSYALELGDAFSSAKLGKTLQYFEDPGGRLRFDDAATWQRWEQSSDASLSFGFSESAYWIRIPLSNSGARTQTLVLDVDHPFLDEVDAYIKHPEARSPEVLRNGDSRPATQRTILHSHMLFPFEVEAGETITVYLRVRSHSTMHLPLTLWSQQAFIEHDQVSSIMLGLFLGALLALGTFYVLLYIFVKEATYLHYGLLVLSLFGTYLCLHGIPNVYFWPTDVFLSDIMLVLSVLSSIVFGNLMTLTMLTVSDTRPKLALALKTLASTAVALAAISWFIPYGVAVKSLIGIAIATTMVMTYAYAVRLFDGCTIARYTLISTAVVSAGFIVMILTKTGNLPSLPITEGASHIGIVVMTILFSLALSDGINQHRVLREQAQQQLLDAQQEINDNLDQIVRERTRELESANLRLREISDTDGLTRINNRRYFDEVFKIEYKRAFRERQPLAVLLIDIDYFKMVNDKYGHQVGDECLIEVAKTILACIRRPPDIAARYGGEEFVVALPNTALDGAIRVAETINRRFDENAITARDIELKIRVSIGVACTVPASKDSADELLKRADELLYQAKENGRNRVEWIASTSGAIAALPPHT